MLFDSQFQEALVALMTIDTVTPMETGRGSEIAEANRLFADLAHRVGMRTIFEGPGSLDGMDPSRIPVSVQRRMAEQPDFLLSQPNLVLAIGEGGFERTLMFNFHMDTVSPHLPVRVEDGVIHGRGAVDNKGPGVAILAALHRLRQEDPAALSRMRVLVQCVAGEEGGAMGVHGTRHLFQLGHVGRLNVFAEPTAFGFFDSCTCSMTFEVDVDGQGCTDDFPHLGDNASVALGFIAQHMGRVLAQPLSALDAKLTVGGLHTGDQHNRVYGSGRLLMNIAYPDAEAGRACGLTVEQAFQSALTEFQRAFAGLPLFERTVRRLPDICRRRWLKVGLPVLGNRDSAMEALLARAGFARDANAQDAFTCDAIWGNRAGAYSVVAGPGTLAGNGAHTAQERVSVDDLERFSGAVHALMLAFARQEYPGEIP